MTPADQKTNLEIIKNPNEAEYTLETPIEFGGQTIEKIIIRKPTTIALAGISLQDLFRSDVNALCAIIPKVTWPQLPKEIMPMLDPVDLGQIAGHIVYFLMPKSQRAAVDIQL
jgi:hypothetical protein